MPVVKPTIASPNADGFSFSEVQAVFRKKCRVYFALGAIDDTDMPTNKATTLALYVGASKKFLPMGILDEDHGKIEAKQMSYNADYHLLGGPHEIDMELNSMRFDPGMMAYFDSAEGRGIMSFMFVPDGDVIGETLLVVNGTTITRDTNVPTSGKDASKTIFRAKTKAEVLSQKIIYKIFTS